MQHGTSYAEGLNYVPFLTQVNNGNSNNNTPPSSSRTNYSQSSARRRSSTLSLPRAMTSPSLSAATATASTSALNYNGNYEGDASMFGHRRQPLPTMATHRLIDTDSETDFERCVRDVLQAKRAGAFKTLNGGGGGSSGSNTLISSTPITTSASVTMMTLMSTATSSAASADDSSSSQLKRLCAHYVRKYLPAQRLTKLTAFAERLQHNRFCCKLYALLCFVAGVLLWLVRWLVGRVAGAHVWTQHLWRGKTLLRNVARRLLWWMTLAKFKDITYFLLIIVATPPLFVVAVVGLVLSVYCATKDYVYRSGGFLRHRVF